MIPLPRINSDGSYTTPPSPMAIDADGANGQTSLPVYAPVGMEALDYLANAGGPGNWYGVVTDNGEPIGRPIIQTLNDPKPGAYVSATSYRYDFPRKDPRAYVDSNSVIYIVLPSHWRKEARGVVLGCAAEIYDTLTEKTVAGVVADFGPKAKLGEASMACARYFGVNDSPKHGGSESNRFVYTFRPGIAAPGFELQPM